MLRFVIQRKAAEADEDVKRRILAAHQYFVSKGDLVNGLEYWDAHLPYYFRSIVCAGRHDFAKKSILSSFMPKSGGTFLHNRMIGDFGYKEFWWGITDPRNPSSVCTSARSLGAYCLGGFTCHTHFVPTAQNMRHIEQVYGEKIWVHLRNPIECVVAGYHHYKGQAQGVGTERESRLKTIETQIKQYDLHLDEVDGYAIKHIDFFSNWLGQWIEFNKACPGRVSFTFFDELNNIEMLFNRVFSNLNCQISTSEVSKTHPNDRIRQAGEMRESLSPKTVKLLTERLATQFGRDNIFERLIAGSG